MNMFPDTITIYHHETKNGIDNYQKTILRGFYWCGGRTLSGTGKGIESKSETTIISNADNAHSYGSKWAVNIGDRIILGEGEDISSFKALNNAITVADIANHVCGSDVDNIVITGV